MDNIIYYLMEEFSLCFLNRYVPESDDTGTRQPLSYPLYFLRAIA